jgi:hypothetical protein
MTAIALVFSVLFAALGVLGLVLPTKLLGRCWWDGEIA